MSTVTHSISSHSNCPARITPHKYTKTPLLPTPLVISQPESTTSSVLLLPILNASTPNSVFGSTGTVLELLPFSGDGPSHPRTCLWSVWQLRSYQLISTCIYAQFRTDPHRLSLWLNTKTGIYSLRHRWGWYVCFQHQNCILTHEESIGSCKTTHVGSFVQKYQSICCIMCHV